MQDVLIDFVKGANIRIPVLVQTRDDLVGGRREVLFHHVRQRGFGPVRIGFAQEVRNLHRVLLPSAVGLLLGAFIAGLRRFDQVDRNRDVLLQERGELLTGSGAVEFGGYFRCPPDSS